MILRATLLGAGAFLACRLPLPTPDELGETAPSSDPSAGGVLELASYAELRSLDPANITDGLAPNVIELLYAGLVDYDHEGKIVPDLAESYQVSEDGLQFTFRLRPNLRFHDGTELHAADVKRSIERSLGPASANASRAFFESLLGFEDFTEGRTPHLAGVETHGSLVLVLRLAHADATFERVLPLQTLRPVCASMGNGDSLDATPCGAGPFRLEGWRRGQDLTLRRFEGYHVAGRPYLDGVHMTFRSSLLSQRFRFERGEQHVLTELSSTDQTRFFGDARWSPYRHVRPPTTMNAEGMNTEIPPFDNPDVRRAVSFAIDREQYAKLWPGMLVPLTQPVPEGAYGHDPQLACQRHDLAEARRLMARAGYPYDPDSGRGGYPHPIPYLTYRKGLTEYTAQLLKQQLAKIGLTLDVRLSSYSTYLSIAHRRHGVAMSYQGWSMDYSDPANFTETLFHSRAIQEEDSTNSSFYRNSTLDRLLDQGKSELNRARRRAFYGQAQELLCDDAPWAFTTSMRSMMVTRPEVRGFRSHVMWSYDLRDTWLARAPSPSLASQAWPLPERAR